MAETEQAGAAGLQRVGQAGVTSGGAAATPGAKALAMVAGLRQRVMALPAGKRTWLFASVAFLAAICVGMMWFAGRPDWRVLFSGLDGKDVQQVSQELAAAGIPYEMTADGGGAGAHDWDAGRGADGAGSPGAAAAFVVFGAGEGGEGLGGLEAEAGDV